MCFFRYGLLAVPLLAAFAAFAAEPPRYLQGVPARATHGASVSVPDLHWAAIEGDVAEVKRLIAAGADMNDTETLYGGQRALHWAVHGGSGVVRALLAAGAALEAQDDTGETALFGAVRSNDDVNYRALKALLVAGADTNARGRNPEYTYPLHNAVMNDQDNGWQAVLLLRGFGADPNATNGVGATPLHYAATRTQDDFWGFALMRASLDPHQRALDVNVQDDAGMTPLHWVVNRVSSARDPGVLLWLLNNGADVNAVDNSGRTPLDWADSTGADDLAYALRGNGGENRYVP